MRNFGFRTTTETAGRGVLDLRHSCEDRHSSRSNCAASTRIEIQGGRATKRKRGHKIRTYQAGDKDRDNSRRRMGMTNGVCANQTSDRQSGTPTSYSKNSRKSCFRCNSTEHLAQQCRFSDAQCRFCGKKGHLERACLAKQKGLRPNVKKTVRMVQAASRQYDNNQETEESEERIFSCTGEGSQAFETPIQINGKDVRMEIDSGASYTIISRKTMETLWKDISVQLKPCNIKFVDYQNNEIKILGKIQCKTTFKGRTASLPLVVTEGNRPSLLGRNWFKPLGISIQINQVTENRAQLVDKLLQEFTEVFDEKLGTYRGKPIAFNIDKSVAPICMKARSVAYAIRPKVEEEIDRLVRQGVLEQIEDATWATPIVTVMKADGKGIRICGDYNQTLNKALKWNPYPMPSVNEMLATLEPNVRYFTKLDLAQAYQQLTVDEETARAQALITHKGVFKVKRLQFGVAVAPQIFQCCINNRLAGIPGTVPYFDDILISGDSIEQLYGRVKLVLTRLATDGLKLRKDKCVFFVDRIKFLGYEISNVGIRPLDSKIQAIREAKRPNNIKQLQSFLGLVNFYHMFLKDKAVHAEALHRLLDEKTAWKWQQAEEEAFQALKKLITSDALLIH